MCIFNDSEKRKITRDVPRLVYLRKDSYSLSAVSHMQVSSSSRSRDL